MKLLILALASSLAFAQIPKGGGGSGGGGGGGSGTVTSVATTGPITGGTITTTGTIACATCGVTGTGLNQFASTTSAQLAGVLSDKTGTGVAVFATSPTFTTPLLGTPTSGVMTNVTGLPVATGISGLGSGVATFLATPTGANFNAMVTAGVQIPQNSKSAAYTTVLTDCMGSIYHPSADTTARTWTIDSNANVAAPIGCTITFVNDTSGGVLTLAITSDTMVLAGAGTTGSRTLAASGIATATKVTSTRWIINGTGLT